MEVGLVGLPGSGKTTLYNALTGSHVSGFSETPHVGVAIIPDPRLDLIAQYIPPQKIVPATLRLVDIPGVPPGSDAKKLNSFLEHVRQVDAACHVVRCFDDGSGVIDPAGDIEKMDTELILADLVVAEGAREKATKIARRGEADAKARLRVLDRVAATLGEEQPIRSVSDWSDTDRVILGNYGFITAKPVIYVANIDESDLDGVSDHARAVYQCVQASGAHSLALCAKLEAELTELEEPDHTEMLESLGLSEPAVGPLARVAHESLGLTTFYTAGDKEVRAWTIAIGATAPEAAGAIHSDMQRGFIRAECFNVDELVEFKSEKVIREAGRLRSEGKHYELQDGDVVHFLFNV